MELTSCWLMPTRILLSGRRNGRSRAIAARAAASTTQAHLFLLTAHPSAPAVRRQGRMRMSATWQLWGPCQGNVHIGALPDESNDRKGTADDRSGDWHQRQLDRAPQTKNPAGVSLPSGGQSG